MVYINDAHTNDLFKFQLTGSCRVNNSPTVSILGLVFCMNGHCDPSNSTIVIETTVSIENVMHTCVVQSMNEEDGNCVHRLTGYSEEQCIEIFSIEVHKCNRPTPHILAHHKYLFLAVAFVIARLLRLICCSIIAALRLLPTRIPTTGLLRLTCSYILSLLLQTHDDALL